MALRSANMNIMIRAAENAGRTLIRDFNEIAQLQISRKSPIPFMQKAKEKAAEIIIEELSAKRPDFAIFDQDDPALSLDVAENLFIINALEGEENYAHALPFWCITIHFIKMGKTKASLIYDPINHELFWAQFGVGAFLNNHKLYISKRNKMAESFFAVKLPPYAEPHHSALLKQISYLSQKKSQFRDYGCTSLNIAYAAAGRFDGYFGADLDIHMINAGELYMTEAGGFCQTYWPNEDETRKGFVGSNEAFLSTLHNIIIKSYQSTKK